VTVSPKLIKQFAEQNLVLMTKKEHMRLHTTGTGKTITGAVIHERIEDFRDVYPRIGGRVSGRIADQCWKYRVKLWQAEPVKVKFT
jgi:hypothetical protein